jgi:hypothetical protein
MDEIEAFLDECRADPWFQSHPEVVDRLESVLTKFYFAGEGLRSTLVRNMTTTPGSSPYAMRRRSILPNSTAPTSSRHR